MKKLGFLVLCLCLFAILSSCSNANSQNAGSQATAKPTASAAKTTRVLNPLDLLTAEEASRFVGRLVKANADPPVVSDTGEYAGTYIYDFADRSTVIAEVFIVQNGLISKAELNKGHDAKWLYADFKKLISQGIVAVTDLDVQGSYQAFYVKANMEVNFLFGDYFVTVAFIADNNDAATLSMNKLIAAHLIDKIMMAESSATPAK